MNVITISREFGSGGRELGKRLAQLLGYDYYDREIITAIAGAQGLDEGYVEHVLNNSAWQTIPLTFRHSFACADTLQSIQTGLLLEQTRVIEQIGKTGRDCVIVGRNADVVLQHLEPLHLFVCADMDAKVRRCMERAADGEQLSRREMEQLIRRIDKNRIRTREFITGGKWGDRSAYAMIVNTTYWEIAELAPAVAEFARCWFARTNTHSGSK